MDLFLLVTFWHKTMKHKKKKQLIYSQLQFIMSPQQQGMLLNTTREFLNSALHILFVQGQKLLKARRT